MSWTGSTEVLTGPALGFTSQIASIVSNSPNYDYKNDAINY